MRNSVSASPTPGRRSASTSGRRSASIRAGSTALAAAAGPGSGPSTTAIENTGAGFSQRNLYYLRSSPYTVLQMVLYLDARHTAWMNAPSEEAGGLRANGEVILQKALAVLRTRIMDKLRRESGSGGRMGVVSRKEKVDVYASYDFQMAYFFRKMSDRHAVLLKDKSLVFPHSDAPMPLSSEPEAGNAPIPSASERAAKRRRVDEEKGANLFMEGGEEAAGTSDNSGLPAPVKAEEDTDAAEAFLHGSAMDEDNSGAFQDDFEQTYLAGADDDAAADQASKPHLRVKYAGFRIFGKMLVVVIEPSKSVIVDNPELFGAAQPKEVRQLSVTPMPGGAAAGRATSRARTQSRLTSVRAPSEAMGPPPPPLGRAAREGSQRDSRAPSPGIGATLFLGGTPTPTPEPESRRFGSRGVSRAMSATPGPGLAAESSSGVRRSRRDGSRSPEPRTNVLAGAINQRSGRAVRKLPPVPLFDGSAPREEEEEEQDDAADRRRQRQSQAPSPTPEPTDDSALPPARPRASSIMPRRASRPLEEGEDAIGEADVDMAFDFGGDMGEGYEPAEGGEQEEDSDEDEPATGVELATQMMEAGGHAGQRGMEAEEGD